MSVATILKSIRKENNLTLKDLSQKSGLSISFLSDIENMRRNPSIETLEILAKALNISITNFFDNNSEKYNNNNSDKDIRRIERARNKMTPKDKDKMMKILEASFEDYFNDED